MKRASLIATLLAAAFVLVPATAQAFHASGMLDELEKSAVSPVRARVGSRSSPPTRSGRAPASGELKNTPGNYFYLEGTDVLTPSSPYVDVK